MLEQDATVVASKDDMVWVEAVSRSSCSSCSAGSCSTSVVSKLFGLKQNRLQMRNTLQAKIGDKVIIGIPDSVLVKASIWAYLLPVVCMMLVTALAMKQGYGDGIQVLAAMIGLAGGFWFVGRVTRVGKQQGTFDPLLLRIKGQSVILRNPTGI